MAKVSECCDTDDRSGRTGLWEQEVGVGSRKDEDAGEGEVRLAEKGQIGLKTHRNRSTNLCGDIGERYRHNSHDGKAGKPNLKPFEAGLEEIEGFEDLAVAKVE